MKLEELVASLTSEEREAMATGIRNRPLKAARFLWTDGACALGTMGLELGLFEPMPKGASDHDESGKEGTFSDWAELANEGAYKALSAYFRERGRNFSYRDSHHWDNAIDDHGRSGILTALEAS